MLPISPVRNQPSCASLVPAPRAPVVSRWQVGATHLDFPERLLATPPSIPLLIARCILRARCIPVAAARHPELIAGERTAHRRVAHLGWVLRPAAARGADLAHAVHVQQPHPRSVERAPAPRRARRAGGEARANRQLVAWPCSTRAHRAGVPCSTRARRGGAAPARAAAATRSRRPAPRSRRPTTPHSRHASPNTCEPGGTTAQARLACSPSSSARLCASATPSACVTSAPFGSPVVPDVYMIAATSPGSGSARSVAGQRSSSRGSPSSSTTMPVAQRRRSARPGRRSPVRARTPRAQPSRSPPSAARRRTRAAARSCAAGRSAGRRSRLPATPRTGRPPARARSARSPRRARPRARRGAPPVAPRPRAAGGR